MCRSEEQQTRPDWVLLCPRLPGPGTGYSTTHRTCDARLHSAGGPDVSRREVSDFRDRTRLRPPQNQPPNAWVKRQHQSRSDWSVRLNE